MFNEIETAITGLGMTVCDSLTIPGRRTSRAKPPDAFVSGRASDIPAKLFPEHNGRLYKHQSSESYGLRLAKAAVWSFMLLEYHPPVQHLSNTLLDATAPGGARRMP